MRIQSIFCCMALLLAMQLNAQIHNVENFKGRITIPLNMVLIIRGNGQMKL